MTDSATDLVIYSGEEPCPYLPEQRALLPLRWPDGLLSPADFDQRLADGDRRSGPYLYRPQCPRCQACEAIRLNVATFRPNRTQARQWKRGQRLLEARIIEPAVDQPRVDLFNKHRLLRGLGATQRQMDASGYENFLVDSCCNTVEIDLLAEGQLKAVAICDQGGEAISAVYCYFDPDYRELSLGVYSVLLQLEYCRAWSKSLLYLGFYIADSPHMRYKSQYLPHERLIQGVWTKFDREREGDG